MYTRTRMELYKQNLKVTPKPSPVTISSLYGVRMKRQTSKLTQYVTAHTLAVPNLCFHVI